jgi:hypothetical protein
MSGQKTEPKDTKGTVQAAAKGGMSPLSLMDAQQQAANAKPDNLAQRMYPSSPPRKK